MPPDWRPKRHATRSVYRFPVAAEPTERSLLHGARRMQSQKSRQTNTHTAPSCWWVNVRSRTLTMRRRCAGLCHDNDVLWVLGKDTRVECARAFLAWRPPNARQRTRRTTNPHSTQYPHTKPGASYLAGPGRVAALRSCRPFNRSTTRRDIG